MKKWKFIGIIAFIVLVISLLIMNYRYPFVTEKVGKWSVGYGFSEDPITKTDISEDHLISYEKVDSLLQNEGNYIADPFFIKEKDSFYLFTELKGQKNADIALFTSANGLNYEYKGVVLNEDFHLSYPQVFKYRDEFYMLPETNQSGNVLLYKAEDFPYQWRIVDTLIENVNFKDPSLLLSPDLNLIVTVDDHMNQLMFTADSLEGQWREVRKYTSKKGNETRPGGRFFNYKGEWFLPIQDRRFGYGSGISIYRLKNSEENIELVPFKNRYLKEMKNIKWFNRGMHQLDIQKIGDAFYSVYDGDRNINREKAFQIKRTLKYNWYDFSKLWR
ncbi:hypothetical protein RM553_09340 [Zunongwangia sp. F363]|uniref:Glucosamine inositolphosphorylceramide transferase 1 N-terminal domain-containing protein n=1 Tax=Autumnicola tepida TaxID=3075595 RepID=A0ABU3C9M0_9FLAO|nr:hypothetical protein [Zunongwangia sp. F363]MDT0643029.1 hypothetical protein [Zunongwangia sp. F363]